MERFHLHIHMIINPEIAEKLKKYSKDNLDFEVCGFIVKNDKNLQFIPVENKHTDKRNYFLVSPRDYLAVKDKYKIIYFFHSHLNKNSFSNLDILYQKYHNIDMLIYNIDSDEFIEMKCK